MATRAVSTNIVMLENEKMSFFEVCALKIVWFSVRFTICVPFAFNYEPRAAEVVPVTS